MSYVPPHLRAAAAASTVDASANYRTTTPKPSARFLESDGNPRSTADSFSYSGRRSGGVAQPTKAFPEPAFGKWQPSDRVLRLTPEQCLHPSIMKDIAYHDYTRPTSIQAQAMPIALSGRDILGCAETGSGKTAAFAIPMIQHCLGQQPIRQGDGPMALVLAPTRELAQQIEKEVKAFSRSLEKFRTAIVVGGTNIGEQRADLRAGVQIVVATPGRFIDHLQQGNTSLSRISFVVLDEADRMLDMGFEPQIREIMRNLPEKHQTLLFSATMPIEIETLSQEYLKDPVQVKVGKVSSPTANVSQVLDKVAENEKIDGLLSLLVEEASQAEKLGHPFPLTIVFVERKTRCDEVAEALVAQGLPAVALHGGHSQKEREYALNNFRKGSTSILVATDVASRGLDVAGVSHVINLDLPKTLEDYVHRIGRTGRAGSSGRATSFYTDRDMFLVAHIRKAISDAESGNAVSFATGKTARKKEREAATAQKEARLGLSKLSVNDPGAISVDDRYRYMLTPSSNKKEGAADDAWDD
ncbi:unnamed protein product [Spirodela intermedia]|uniref:Uncharacterized protein n=1 Tax=Spirodela intermedia TaxID=51605 RepID=A0A7I8K0J7_SPIIN|nr:unnamed protein product [Spirodela intermedia]